MWRPLWTAPGQKATENSGILRPGNILIAATSNILHATFLWNIYWYNLLTIVCTHFILLEVMSVQIKHKHLKSQKQRNRSLKYEQKLVWRLKICHISRYFYILKRKLISEEFQKKKSLFLMIHLMIYSHIEIHTFKNK